MDLVGGLLYLNTVGDTYYMSYVVADARLFSVNIHNILISILGDVPPLIGRIPFALKDAAMSITNNIVFGRADSVLANIPETIAQGITITTMSWMQGGSLEYWTCPADVVLAGVSANPTITTVIIPDLTSLQIFGLSVVTAWYKPVLGEDDYYTPNPDWYDFVTSGDGKYYYHYPRKGIMDAVKAGNRRTVSRQDFIAPYPSHLYCGWLGVFEPTDPPLPGSYYHEDATLSFNDGVSPNSGVIEPFLSDTGYDSSNPFNATIPTDAVLLSSGLVRLWQSQDAVVNCNDLGDGGSYWSFPGLSVFITPKRQPEPLQGTAYTSVHIPLAVMIGYRILMRQLGCLGGIT